MAGKVTQKGLNSIPSSSGEDTATFSGNVAPFSKALDSALSKPKPKKTGRPAVYTDEIANSICAQVMLGSNLHKICKDPDMPNRDTVYQWLVTNPTFSDNYARATKIRREDKYDKLEEIADQEEDVQRARLKVDVIKWQLSKEEPRKYGDKLDVTSDGKALPTPIFSGLSVVDNPADDIKDSEDSK